MVMSIESANMAMLLNLILRITAAIKIESKSFVPSPAQAGLFGGRFFDGNFAICQNFTIFDS
jgi:hypothetical protein